jgi:hypothetical protein
VCPGKTERLDRLRVASNSESRGLEAVVDASPPGAGKTRLVVHLAAAAWRAEDCHRHADARAAYDVATSYGRNGGQVGVLGALCAELMQRATTGLSQSSL